MLTASQAAGVLGVKLGTLYAYVSRGWVKSYRRKIGRQALYRRDDIEALRGVVAPERGRRGRSLPPATSWVTVAQAPAADAGAPGVIVAESAVSAIIDGRLCYRGYPIEELVARASFEEVCLLLWSGEPPRLEEVAALAAEISGARIPDSVAAALRAVGRDAPPVWKLAAVMPSLAALEHHQGARARIQQATSIISVLPLALARNAAPRGGQTGPAMAARLLGTAHAATPAEWEIHALDHMLVACAEHELNASTFAARVIASTGADLYASVLASLCSLSGPIHGGACDRIERMFAALGEGVRINQCLDGFAREQQLPPGFGHAIYPEGDPRAVLLKRNAGRDRAPQGPALARDRAQGRSRGLEAPSPAPQSRFLFDRVRRDAGLLAEPAGGDLRSRTHRRMDRAQPGTVRRQPADSSPDALPRRADAALDLSHFHDIAIGANPTTQWL